MSSIVTRSPGGIADQRIATSAYNWARPHGVTGWNTLRFGLLLQVSNTGANLVSTPELAIGLCSGSSNLLFDATTTNFLGLRTIAASWTYAAASGGNMAYYSTGNVCPMKKVNVTETNGSNFAGGFTIPSDPTTATRKMFFVDLIRGSPNWTVRPFNCNSIVSSDVTPQNFLDTVNLTTPSFTGHTWQTGVTIAFDEVAGTLDHVIFAFDQAGVTFEICDHAVVKLA